MPPPSGAPVKGLMIPVPSATVRSKKRTSWARGVVGDVKHAALVVAADREQVLPGPVNFQVLGNGERPVCERNRPGQAGLEHDPIAQVEVIVGRVDHVAEIALQAGA
jgi:hypothetical protein